MEMWELMEEAKKMAANRYLPPKYSPITAGITGFLIVGGTIGIFMGLSGIEGDSVVGPHNNKKRGP